MVSVHNFDPSPGCDDATFQPCSPRALSSLKVVGDRCKGLYPLGRNFKLHGRTSRGFFAEDVFIGGHVPQLFAAFNSAEQLFDAFITWDDLFGYIKVTPVSLKFWEQHSGSHVQVMTHKGSPGYKVLTGASTMKLVNHMGPAEWFATSHRRSPSSTRRIQGIDSSQLGPPLQKSNEIPAGWPVNNAQAKRYRPSPDLYHQHTSYDGDAFRVLSID
ncbi:hypothetical protein EDB86DRAFT_3077751 [Lactarius hatsudake]|nr:hypothetical protein EDB86DRAFT_3077751 [Lactarius hatsudake]